MRNETGTTNKPRKSAVFCGVWYPEDASHSQALAELFASDVDYWACLHDEDINENGEIKKPHYHVVFRFPSARSLKSVASSFGLAENYIQPCSNIRGAIRYLVHKDDSDKHQYSPDSIVTNSPLVFKRALQEPQNEESSVRAILDYINQQDFILSVSSVLFWVLDNGYYSAWRRGYSMFNTVIKEHNLCVAK